jgi:hypothetical protein
MSISDAIAHLDAAKSALTLEAYRGVDPEHMERLDHFTIAEELDRIDRALGPKGQSMFASMADTIRETYTEIIAARAALSEFPRQEKP